MLKIAHDQYVFMTNYFTITEDHLDILHFIQNEPVLSQRKISQKTGLSIGKVNYIIKSLIHVGLVKIDNFSKSTNKINYSYVLTSKGIEEKTALTKKFISIKKKEYNKLISYI